MGGMDAAEPSKTGTARAGTIVGMLRWLRQLLSRKRRPAANRLVMELLLSRPEVPVGRRRITTTVEDFEEHVAKRRSGTR